MKKIMTYEGFKSVIRNLSRSQGSYGRMYQDILESEDRLGSEFIEDINQVLKENEVRSSLDLVFLLEG